MQELKYCAWFGGITGIVSYLFGGFDYILRALLLVIMVDFVTGVVSAGFFHKSKYGNGINSSAMIKGALRKLGILTLVCLANIMDSVLKLDYIRNAVVMYLIASEGISIIENLINMGVPIPKFLTSIMESVKDKNDNTATKD